MTLLTCSTIQAQDNPRIAVTWVENGDVFVWRTGETDPTRYTSGSAYQQPVLSSDGQYIAFLSTMPSSLWVITPADANPIEIVPNTALASSNAENIHIGSLLRGANGTFYFNTYLQPSRITMQAADLWMVDAKAKTYKQILPSGQAGAFSVSPDGQRIALMQSGAYNTADATISLVDSKAENRLDVLSFPAVSTASDYDFYPQIIWNNDSTTFNVAIPDKDLVYHDDKALTTMWQVSIDGTATSLGTVQASFFGLPQWSPSGRNLFYMRHKGDISSNQFELVIPPDVYATGEAGNIGTPEWLPLSDSDLFIYQQGEPGDYWLGMPTQAPSPFPHKLFAPKFVDASTYVYSTASGNVFELRYANRNSIDSSLIATVQNAVPIFDAVTLP